MSYQQTTILPDLPAPKASNQRGTRAGRTTKKQLDNPERRLREALAPYLDLRTLRTLAATGQDIHGAIVSADGQVPEEVETMLAAVSIVLRPTKLEQIKSPTDAAAFLMAEMGHLDQEELRVICLNTKSRIQAIETVYRGSLNAALVRVGELFKPAIRLNSASIIVCHNHPSADVTPSPEDVMLTRQIVEAGKLLDVEVLDHLILGQGQWTSLRQRGLGFGK